MTLQEPWHRKEAEKRAWRSRGGPTPLRLPPSRPPAPRWPVQGWRKGPPLRILQLESEWQFCRGTSGNSLNQFPGLPRALLQSRWLQPPPRAVGTVKVAQEPAPSPPSAPSCLSLRGCLGQQERQRLVPPRAAGSLMGSSSSSEAESRGPVTHQTGRLDDKASRALGEPGRDTAVAAAHFTPLAPAEGPRWGASLGRFTRLGVAAHIPVSRLTPASFLLPPPSEGGGSHRVPAGKPGSWSLFLVSRAEHRAPHTVHDQEMCSQEPGDRWSLVHPAVWVLGRGEVPACCPQW